MADEAKFTTAPDDALVVGLAELLEDHGYDAGVVLAYDYNDKRLRVSRSGLTVEQTRQLLEEALRTVPQAELAEMARETKQ